ncbi:unnamed protein product [Diatraea saccharalis]|uniref:Clip domain-containing protein n=1 Tax=Diatraea saccharalis TaxID=40085 RepID=A0A9N9R9S0_9NEOP|nr:unnamed protein product [Diatraea saccharalis]
MKFIVYIFVFITVNGEPCDLPDGSKGNCVQIFGCPYLADLVRNEQRTEQELELLQNSSCGFEGNKPKVCCPSSCLTLEGEQGICVNRESCPHLPKNSQAKSGLVLTLRVFVVDLLHTIIKYLKKNVESALVHSHIRRTAIAVVQMVRLK